MSENKFLLEKKSYLRLSLYALVLVLVFLFGVSLFKNISYPLIWGDEAETAIYAGRILKHGFPVVHDGNNTMYLEVIKDWEIVSKKNDLYIGNVWGQYYFAAIGEYFAGKTNDIYQKTKYLRIPFAGIGLLGVLILPTAFLFIFKKGSNKKLLFLICYLTLTLFLISLVLHLREVRNYSLVVFLLATTIFTFTKTYFTQVFPKWLYVFLMTTVLVLLFNSFPPGFLAIFVSLGSYVVIDYYLSDIYRKNLKGVNFIMDFFKKSFCLLLPLCLSAVAIIPIYLFFKMSQTSSLTYLKANYTYHTYFYYLTSVINFLALHNFLILAVFQKVVLVFLYYFLRKKIDPQDRDRLEIKNIYRVSNFVTYICLIHILMAPLTPFLFNRYYLFVQPLLVVVITIDFFLNIEIFRYLASRKMKLNFMMEFFFTLLFFFMISMVFKLDTIKGHLYELQNRYYGPVDFIVGYIKANYQNTEDLVITTNVEESSFIYYLKSQVMCDEIIKCKKALPDISIIRLYRWSSADFTEKTEKLISSGQYKKILLPILDYQVNNIPEFTLPLRHLFKTPLTDNNDEKTWLLVRK